MLVPTCVVIGARTIFSSRSVNGWRVTYSRVVVDVQSVRDIDPREAVNMAFLLAFEWTQADPHRFWLNDFASKNMEFMLVTRDTSHFDMSILNDDAP